MESSILASIKKLLGGIAEECDDFDPDIIFQINAALSALNQLGVGPEDGFVIYDSSATWDELLNNSKNLETVKSYVYAKTKLAFDPPPSSALIQVLKDTVDECEFRIIVAVDHNEV